MKLAWMTVVGLATTLAFATQAAATDENPLALGNESPGVPGEATGDLTGYDDRDAWAAAAGNTTLIDFESFASGEEITDDLADRCIAMVTGFSPFIGGPVSVFVTSSADLPFPMFQVGTLPTEPNFLSNDLSPEGGFATGSTTFEMVSGTTAIGAFVADGSPLDNFTIEVFDGNTSLGTITVGPRSLPDSFVGVVSAVPFTKATFRSDFENDSWGLDNLEHNCDGATPTEDASWGRVKTLYR